MDPAPATRPGKMGLSWAVRRCLRKYAVFSGRASRREYWYFVLFLLLGATLCNLIDLALFGGRVVATPDGVAVRSRGPIGSLFLVAMLPPFLAVGWRRMHDTGRSGLFLLYPLIVVAGVGTFAGFVSGFGTLLSGDTRLLFEELGTLVVAAALLVLLISPLLVLWWLVRPSQPGANAFGPPAQ